VRLVDADTGDVVQQALAVSGDGSSHRPAWKTLSAPIPSSPSARRLAIELVAVDDPAIDGVVVGSATTPDTLPRCHPCPAGRRCP
jgi:hypothetical protein